MKTKLLDLGQILATPGAQKISPDVLLAALARHCQCDWGECCPEDKQQNDWAVENGGRVMSVWHAHHPAERSGEIGDFTTFWIITEADHSITTFLLPSEY